MTAITVRMAIYDDRLWNPTDIVNLYKVPLSAIGFTTDQYPAVVYPNVTQTITLDDPFPGAKNITWSVPGLPEQSQLRDTRVPLSQDPAKLAEVGNVLASVFTWNLCAPASSPSSTKSPAPSSTKSPSPSGTVPAGEVDPTGLARNLFRSITASVGSAKTNPIVSTYQAAPAQLAPYPPKQGEPGCGAGAGAGATGLGLGAMLAAGLGIFWVFLKKK